MKLCPTGQEGVDGQESPVSEESNGGVGEAKPEPNRERPRRRDKQVK